MRLILRLSRRVTGADIAARGFRVLTGHRMHSNDTYVLLRRNDALLAQSSYDPPGPRRARPETATPSKLLNAWSRAPLRPVREANALGRGALLRNEPADEGGSPAGLGIIGFETETLGEAFVPADNAGECESFREAKPNPPASGYSARRARPVTATHPEV